LSKKIKYEVGDILLVSSFAGPKVYKKVLKKINKEFTLIGKKDTLVGFEGCFVRRKDLIALKKMCVPYTGKEKLRDQISFVYDFQILKKIK
tara:strand:- start:4671 stop:4943 length:273 start_codon:yes stop_codon:yes gene_type:complete